MQGNESDKQFVDVFKKYIGGDETLTRALLDKKLKEANNKWLERMKGLKYKAFLELLDECCTIYSNVEKDEEIRNIGKITNQRIEGTRYYRDLLMGSRIFIFDSNLSPPTEDEIEKNHNNETPISLPFKTCTFEMVGKTCFSSAPNRRVLCVLLHETSVGSFEGAELYIDDKPDGKCSPGWAQFYEEDALIYARIVDSALKRCKLGIEKVNERLRVGKGKNRELVRIKEVVRISPKGLKKEDYERPLLGRSIDWSHQWEVMGHWRKSATIGKDQAGNYCVEGFTWIVPHTRGPENKPLVKKQRLLSDSGVI